VSLQDLSAHGNPDLVSSDAFQKSVVDGWVWMDYISIPQTIGLSTEAEPQAVLKQQAAAIESIPEYVKHAKNFWVCAPSGARHVDAGIECNYETWHSRA
jgi:hypothetical protein